MSGKFDLTIVIAAYNVEKYIEECLDSLKFEKITFEIILINDASTDGTEKKICTLAKNRTFSFINFEENQGISEVRNIGIKYASGRYIAFIDGDDFIYPDIVEKLILQVDQTCDAIIGNYDSLIEDSNQLIPNKTRFIGQSTGSGQEMFANYILNSISASVWKGIYRRDYLIEKKIFFSRGLIIAEDLEWLVRTLVLAKRVQLCTSSRFYVYRIRKGSVMNTEYSYKKYSDSIQVVSSLLNFSNDSNISDKSRSTIHKVVFALLLQAIGSYDGNIDLNHVKSIFIKIKLQKINYKLIKWVGINFLSITRFFLKFKYR